MNGGICIKVKFAGDTFAALMSGCSTIHTAWCWPAGVLAMMQYLERAKLQSCSDLP